MKSMWKHQNIVLIKYKGNSAPRQNIFLINTLYYFIYNLSDSKMLAIIIIGV